VTCGSSQDPTIVLLFAFTQRYFVQGIQMTGFK